LAIIEPTLLRADRRGVSIDELSIVSLENEIPAGALVRRERAA
jgi:hypothetical protein